MDSFLDFINDPIQDEKACFVRIRRDDYDLVVLYGRLGDQDVALLYQMKFTLTPYPEVKVKKVDKIELLAMDFGLRTWFGKFGTRKKTLKYLKRFFKILNVWQQGMIDGTKTL